MDSRKKISTLLKENRSFPPPKAFKDKANFNDPTIYERVKKDPESYWNEQAKYLDWSKPFTYVLEWDSPHAQWFVDGKLNVTQNCIDRHRASWRKNKAAIIWEGEEGDSKIYTYDMLGREVNKAAHMLKSLGIEKGDRVAIYLPMIPELPISMLACAKIGAIHTVVFAGFSANALKERIKDTEAKLVITSDGSRRGGKIIPLKANTDRAIENTTIENVLVVDNIGQKANATWNESIDIDWMKYMAEMPTHSIIAEEMDAEDILYILYTSGTTGKPKGIVHTTGGYLTWAHHAMRSIFDLKEEDVFWCTADIGWVTGHTFVVYGPLAAGATSVMYEGTPSYPDCNRIWDIVEKYGVNTFYTAPTSIRAFMKWGTEYVDKHDLSSLRLLGTAGEPINPEAWMWFYKHIGNENCPIVDTWWQTETGGPMIAPLPGITTTKPGSATRPALGIVADVLDENEKPVDSGDGGALVIKKPWPAMFRTVWGDDTRYKESYFKDYPGQYKSGDVAHIDNDGYFWILGRDDDVINVSGHRIGTMDVESVIVSHIAVAESAVIGRAHDIKGQAIVAFVTLKDSYNSSDELKKEIERKVKEQIGKFACPEEIIFTASLPKTRSAKIMRRLLRDIAEGKAIGDVTTLEDADVVESLKEKYNKE